MKDLANTFTENGKEYRTILIKDLRKQGEKFFTLAKLSTEDEAKETQVFCLDSYNRSTKKYDCYKFENINSWREFNGNKTVYIGFTF